MSDSYSLLDAKGEDGNPLLVKIHVHGYQVLQVMSFTIKVHMLWNPPVKIVFDICACKRARELEVAQGWVLGPPHITQI